MQAYHGRTHKLTKDVTWLAYFSDRPRFNIASGMLAVALRKAAKLQRKNVQG